MVFDLGPATSVGFWGNRGGFWGLLVWFRALGRLGLAGLRGSGSLGLWGSWGFGFRVSASGVYEGRGCLKKLTGSGIGRLRASDLGGGVFEGVGALIRVP